ncbi:MAG: response regulator [Verrucomicrobia bacterium]|nr:response regulator [Verrucomicrobiota bacterium]
MDALKEKVLLIDDDSHLLRVMGDFLNMNGYQVETALNGEEGLAKVERIDPDLIIMDVKMPVMGGFEFLRRLPRTPGTRRYPVLVLTARTEMREFFDGSEIDGFMEKPCRGDDFITRVREIIEKQASVQTVVPRCMSVLLAESEEAVREELMSVFKDAGHRPIAICNGSRILEAAQAKKPHVIVMSARLSGMGPDLAAALLKAMASTRAIPILVYGDGNGGDDSRLMALREVDRYLPDMDCASILQNACSLSLRRSLSETD